MLLHTKFAFIMHIFLIIIMPVKNTPSISFVNANFTNSLIPLLKRDKTNIAYCMLNNFEMSLILNSELLFSSDF